MVLDSGHSVPLGPGTENAAFNPLMPGLLCRGPKRSNRKPFRARLLAPAGPPAPLAATRPRALRSPAKPMTTSPQIIQGGMGAAVSNWQLANSVSRIGQMGVVSGTALAVVLARRRGVGHRARGGAGAAPAGGRPGRTHAPGPRTPSGAGCGPPRAGGPLRAGRQACRSPFQESPAARPASRARTRRADRGGQLRRSVPGQAWPQRRGRDQSAGKDPVPHAAVAVRRDAGGRRLRADGRRHSAHQAFRAPSPARWTVSPKGNRRN